ENTIEVKAGEALPVLERQCISLSASGLEFSEGIGGTIGEAVAMNAGGHGKQACDVMTSTSVLDLLTGKIETFQRSECEFSYTHSRFGPKDVILKASYEYEHANPVDKKEKIDSIVQWRRENQPGGRNVGSVFQNPAGTS